MWRGRKSFCMCTVGISRVCRGLREWKSRDEAGIDRGAAMKRAGFSFHCIVSFRLPRLQVVSAQAPLNKGDVESNAIHKTTKY